jgi:1-acyl-sn-glycerol-3-phosphate acyltransferase
MIGTIRMALAIIIMLLLSLPMALWQVIALKSNGRLDDGRIPRLWHRMAVKLLGIRVHVRGAPSRQRPLLIASNHISWSDIMVLGSLDEVHFIAKAEVAQWPIFGTLARLQRSVFVERQARRRSGEQATEIAKRMSDGDPMVLFAEGTTGDGNTLLPFKSTLFGAAQAALNDGATETVSIQPVAIAYTRLQGLPMDRRGRTHAAWIGDIDLMPHVARLLREGAMDVEVHFGEPIAFRPGDDRKKVAREVEARVQTMFAKAVRNPI